MDTVGVDRAVCDSVRQGKLECMHVRVNLNVRALVRMHWLKSQAHGCDDSSASTMNSHRAVDSYGSRVHILLATDGTCSTRRAPFLQSSGMVAVFGPYSSSTPAAVKYCTKCL